MVTSTRTPRVSRGSGGVLPPRVVAATFVALLVACAHARPEILGPEARALEAAGCSPVGEVRGVGVGGWGTTRDQQLYWATAEAYALSEPLGATHVAFVSETGDQNELVLEGVAYRCP